MPAPVVLPARAYASLAADHIAGLIDASIVARGSCVLMLCGGSTPGPVYEQLATRRVRWGEVSIYFGDERAVEPDDRDSNFRSARETLLDQLPVSPRGVYRMPAEAIDCDAAARAYERDLPQPVDVLLLGVGPDGHTASLFPGAESIDETARRVICTPPPRWPLQPALARMTITPPVLSTARTIVVLVTGAEKAPMVARILDGTDDPKRLPAQLARRGTWILDQAAAAQLQPRKN